MEPKFKVGGRVKYIGTLLSVPKGASGTVLRHSNEDDVRVVFDGISSSRTDNSYGVLPENLEQVECNGCDPAEGFCRYCREVASKAVSAGSTPTDSATKPTNPKDAIGSTKLGLDVVPDTLKVYAALAFTEGALKYGSMNWRVAGVRASIYKAALERHLMKYWNGEWADPITGVPHLASVIACAGIILDANAAGMLTDDRPPSIPLARIVDNLEAEVKHLHELFKDKHPHHHIEADKLGPIIPK
ncbi:dATP/dGTP diphosphohydrolase domain-containing protein [Pseudoduganella lutea]|uniref:dATP/dGTP diphosphohydrolase N-terminal domain-containing protein n=1 Tax=Pseudoduganella lutea TaxID=321985 RepID=A0A4P6L591_9BURK|nr:dATP/dGTP diphosphohydrolase domain-containing protein [Pseudoduganella lutea]QBE66846.1 hypothetical protein EWM63_30960 [Pseudoduganella lutea]